MTRLQTEFSFKANPNFLSQIQECEPKQKHIPIAVVLHQSDLERGMVRVRDVETRVEKEVEISGLVEYLKKEPKLNAWPTIRVPPRRLCPRGRLIQLSETHFISYNH